MLKADLLVSLVHVLAFDRRASLFKVKAQARGGRPVDVLIFAASDRTLFHPFRGRVMLRSGFRSLQMHAES
jgi:hypothetical protein